MSNKEEEHPYEELLKVDVEEHIRTSINEDYNSKDPEVNPEANQEKKKDDEEGSSEEEEQDKPEVQVPESK